MTLAFIGDSVFEILVRESLLKNGSMPAGKLHQKAVSQVNASAQAAAHDHIRAYLTEDELDIVRRGRNATVPRTPKSATAEEYHKATALEALFGYLYLAGNTARISELFQCITQQISSTNE